MATTTNYGWTTPDDTALVKDGAAAIRTLGTSVDTTTKNLNPSTTLGDVEYRSSSANVNTRLGIGTTGQVLTVAGGVPSWATPAVAGGMTLLSTTTLSGSSTSITSINQTYTDLQIYVRDFYMSAGGEMNIQFNTDTGSNYMVNAIRQGGDGYQQTQANFPIGGYDVATSDNNNFASMRIIDYANTATVKTISGIGAVVRPSSARGMTLLTGTFFGSTSGISSVQLLASSGTFSAGTVLIYGVK